MSRRIKKLLQLQMENDLKEKILTQEQIGLKVVRLPNKGRGVIATKPFRKEEYITIYKGKLLESRDAEVQETLYDTQNKTPFLFFFQFRGRKMCIDATEETKNFGRLINHSLRGNAYPKVFDMKNKPFIVFLAKRDIQPNEEIAYDYGDRRPSVIEKNPWLNDRSDLIIKDISTLNTSAAHTMDKNNLTFCKESAKVGVRNSTFKCDSSKNSLKILDVSSIRNSLNSSDLADSLHTSSTMLADQSIEDINNKAINNEKLQPKIVQNILLSKNEELNATILKGIQNRQIENTLNDCTYKNEKYSAVSVSIEELKSTITSIQDKIEDSTYLPSTNIESGINSKFLRNSGSSNTQPNLLLKQSFGRDPRQMTVPLSNQGTLKKYGCFYCNKRINKIVRHYETVHRKEDDVQIIIGLKKGSEQRRLKINLLREKGNFRHNTNRNLKGSELIIKRRLQKQSTKTSIDFISCSNCFATYPKSNIRHHKCLLGKPKSTNPNYVLNGKLVERRMHPEANEILALNIFPYFHEDHIVHIIKFDELIVSFGNKLCDKYLRSHQHDMIRAKLRYLGKLLDEVRKLNNEVTDFASIYKAAIYKSVINAINIVAKFDRGKKKYGSPYVATMYGTLLKQVGEHFISKCIMEENTRYQTQAENFLKLLNENYGVCINKIVAEQKADEKRQKPIEMPSKEDISKLYLYVNKLRKDAFSKLVEGFSLRLWTILAESSLICLQIFNRRRAGDTEMIKIEDFKNYYQINVNDKLFNDLSRDGKYLASNNVRFVARGKKNRDAKFICSLGIVKCINLIIAHREQAGVPSTNPYVFGVSSNDSRDKYLRACTLMRKFASKCGALSWKTLRGTKLRKHIATECISLNLNDHEAQGLADYMGHDKRIHDKYYRLSLAPREILHIGKLLTHLQGGKDDEEDCDENDVNKENTESENNKDRHNFTSATKGRNSSSTIKRMKWTSQQTQIIKNAFQHHLKKRTYPSASEIEIVIKENEVLSYRSMVQVKSWIQNYYRKTSNM